jgi:transposase
MGPTLGAEFIAATGGDLTAFASPDRLAGFAGLAPVPWDSGKVSGNLRRPRRYHRGLQRALFLSAQVSVFWCPIPKTYYDRKRKEGKGHKQAVLALARRRVNVLWAMIRDKAPFSPPARSVEACMSRPSADVLASVESNLLVEEAALLVR